MHFRVKLYKLLGLKNRARTLINHLEAKRVTVRVDSYDLHNLDGTLAQVIAPALRKFRSKLNTAPFVEYEDVPENLRPKNPQKSLDDYKKDGTVDELYFKRWEWVLDEMIFAFDSYKNEDIFEHDFNRVLSNQERVQNGLKLFGKYYGGLWD